MVSDSTKVLLAPDATTVGTGSLDLFVADGSTDALFTVQTLEGVTGDVLLTATAPDFGPGNTTVSVVTPFYRLSGLGTSIDTLDPVDNFWISIGLPNGSLTAISA